MNFMFTLLFVWVLLSDPDALHFKKNMLVRIAWVGFVLGFVLRAGGYMW